MKTHNIQKSFNIVLTALLLVGLLLTVTPAQPAFAATIEVDSAADNLTGGDGLCTLREAIMNANIIAGGDVTGGDCTAGDPGADIITFNPTLDGVAITLAIAGANEDVNATGDLDITEDLTINGRGSGITIIDGGALDRVFHIADIEAAADTVIINDLTIRNGNCASCDGGGIYNLGTLTVNRSTITGNQTNGGDFDGGGIYNTDGTLTVNQSTFFDNQAVGALSDGGGIADSGGAITISNSTFLNNFAADAGGGIGLYVTRGASLYNNTITGNSGLAARGGGVMVATGASPSIINTIMANSTGGDCVILGGSITGSYNLVEDTGTNACGLANGVNGNIVGSDPNLGPLADNGGPTQTHALLTSPSASLAIDAGDNTTCANPPVNNLDQRGAARPYNITCDIGAVEYRNPVQDCTGTINADISIGNLTMHFTTWGTMMCVTVEEMGADHLMAPGPASEPNYWHISGDGTGYNVHITFPDSSATPLACRWPGGQGGYGWDCGGTQIDNTGSVTRQNVNSFSDWNVGDNPDPTAISLSTLSAQNAGSISFVALAGVLLLGGVFIWKRKR